MSLVSSHSIFMYYYDKSRNSITSLLNVCVYTESEPFLCAFLKSKQVLSVFGKYAEFLLINAQKSVCICSLYVVHSELLYPPRQKNSNTNNIQW